MGRGEYSVARATTRTELNDYRTKSTREVFSKTSIDNAMNPEGIKVRESRDSDEHPESLPIIIGLDVTGSMGYIPKQLITDGLIHLMDSIIQSGIKDPQVLFMGLGDHEYDRAPLQVAQFESSDELLDKWLKDVYLESGGGGNAGESYPLAWYFAGHHTSIDSMEKRDQKGILITIGDEPPLTNYPREALQKLMGDTCEAQEEKTAGQLLEAAEEKWEVFHINLRETRSGGRPETFGSWKQILGERVKNVAKHEELPNVISDIVLDVTSPVTGEGTSVVESEENKETEIL